MSSRKVETEQDQCADCGLSLEIAAVTLRFFQKPATLFVCPNCARVQADCPNSTRVRVSAWVGALERKSITASRDLAPRAVHSTGNRMIRGMATPLTESPPSNTEISPDLTN